jgi:peptide/nickel transport system substrate-binding protein
MKQAIGRRALLAGLAAGTAALVAPRIARAQARTLTYIPQTDLTILDPIWTTATISTIHGYLIFDTLFGTDEAGQIHPQMAAGHTIEADGLTWRIGLREGLKFHDGEPVRARDVVASLKRWGERDPFGLTLMQATAELTWATDREITFRLHKRFPLLAHALGKTTGNMPCIMPERLALTDPNKQVTEMVGSGPYRFVAAERMVGSQVVYEKFSDYVPSPVGPPSYSAGPKIANFDRVRWTVIPDTSTAAGALQSGQVDWWEQPTPDLIPTLRRARNLRVEVTDPAGQIGIMRFNFLFPPFDKAAVRRAVLPAINQREFMEAFGSEDREFWQDGVGVFTKGSPLASDAGVEILAGNLDAARLALGASGYRGERIIVLAPADQPRIYAMALVGADVLRRIGFNVDLQSLDWGTVVHRRASRQPPDKGGWNVFLTFFTGANPASPAGHLGLRGNGDKAWFGWPTAPELEKLRADWFDAEDLASQQRICREIQLQAWRDVPFVPLGQYVQPVAYRNDLTDLRRGFPQFYGLRRA